MRAVIFASCLGVMLGCSGAGGGGDDGDDDDDGGSTPDADPNAPDADPNAPDANPNAPDADPSAPDAGPRPDGGTGNAGRWHPGYLSLGTIYQGHQGADDFFERVRPRFPASGGLDYGYLYLNGGGEIGEWPLKVTRLVGGSIRNDMTPVLIVYAMNGGSDSAGAVFANMNDAGYLTTYFRALRDAVEQADDLAGDRLVGYILEPDMLGYLQQQIAADHGGDPARIPAATHAVYDSGVLSRGADPDFPDTLVGLVGAINHVIRSHDADAFLGWQLNLWGAPGAPGKGIIHATETLGREAGLANIRANATALADFAARAGIAASDAELVSIDKYGLDGAGAAAADPNNPADSYWFWNADLWSNYLVFVRTLHERLALPVVLWQIPVGHINGSAHPSPTAYNPSGSFPTLANDAQHYEDSASTFFFGDRFTASGARLAYFGRNETGDPEVSASGGTITWGSHFDEAAAAGVVTVLFGAGVGISTRGVPQPNGAIIDEPTDGYYWITRAQEYYAAPVPLP